MNLQSDMLQSGSIILHAIYLNFCIIEEEQVRRMFNRGIKYDFPHINISVGGEKHKVFNSFPGTLLMLINDKLLESPHGQSYGLECLACPFPSSLV